MRDGRFQPVIMGLLYHVSMEDKYKSMFTYTDAIPMILEVCQLSPSHLRPGATHPPVR